MSSSVVCRTFSNIFSSETTGPIEVMCFSEEKQSDVNEAFSSKSGYLDDLLNIDNKYLDGLISQIYPSELQLDKANSSETKVFCICICRF